MNKCMFIQEACPFMIRTSIYRLVPRDRVLNQVEGNMRVLFHLLRDSTNKEQSDAGTHLVSRSKLESKVK